MEKQLIYNAIRTPDGMVLVSKHRHDYVTHTDANGETYFTDGGTEYIRRSVNKIPAEDLSLYDDEPFEVLREHIFRGSRGKSGKEELKYIKLSEISNEYLEDLIDYEEERRPSNPQLKWYYLENDYRNKNGINI
jgi:hypothetical protein